MLQGMGHISYNDRLRAGAVQPREEKAPGRPKSNQGGCKQEGDNSVAGSAVTGQREMVSY